MNAGSPISSLSCEQRASTSVRALLIEHSPEDAERTLHELRRGGFDPSWERVETLEQFRVTLTQKAWDVIIADSTSPHPNAMIALSLLHCIRLDLPLIVVCNHMGEEQAFQLLKAGADDYLLKEHLAQLAKAVHRALGRSAGRRGRKHAAHDTDQVSANNLLHDKAITAEPFANGIEDAGAIWGVNQSGQATTADAQRREARLAHSILAIMGVGCPEIVIVRSSQAWRGR